MFNEEDDMKNTKKIIALSCVLLLFTTGCGKVAKLENGQDAVLTLNDNMSISVDELYSELKNSYAVSILMDMMDEKILNAKYEADEEENESVDSQIQSLVMAYGGEQALLQIAASQLGINTMEGLEAYYHLQYKRNKAIEDYVKSIVTDSEIQTYYDDEIFGDIKASHILIKSEATSSMTESEKQEKDDEALQKAKDIITRLNNGEDFATVAKEVSEDESTKENGGDVGFFAHGDMVEEFEDAAKALNVGEYTKEPVKTEYGYHIILKTEQREKVALDTIRDDIIEDIATEKLTDDPTLQVTALMETRKQAGLKFEDSVFEEQYNMLMEQQKQSLATNK